MTITQPYVDVTGCSLATGTVTSGGSVSINGAQSAGVRRILVHARIAIESGSGYCYGYFGIGASLGRTVADSNSDADWQLPYPLIMDAVNALTFVSDGTFGHIYYEIYYKNFTP